MRKINVFLCGALLGVVFLGAGLFVHRWASDVRRDAYLGSLTTPVQLEFETEWRIKQMAEKVDELKRALDKEQYAKEEANDYEKIGKAVAKELVKAISER